MPKNKVKKNRPKKKNQAQNKRQQSLESLTNTGAISYTSGRSHQL